MTPANRRSADASVIAAIHHPLRRRLIDRIQALGGTMMVDSPSGQGTEVVVDLPLTGRWRESHR